MNYKLAIYAPIRSGTTYMHRLLTQCNVAVGHGNPYTEGVVLWDPRKRLNPIQFEHSWHQTRDPLKSIASIAASAKLFWTLEGEKDPDIIACGPPTRRKPKGYWHLKAAMVYWYKWSLRCEELADCPGGWRYKIEDVSRGSPIWLEICERLGLKDMVFPDLSRKLNSKEHIDLEWGNLKKADEQLAYQILQKSLEFGYRS